MKENKGKGLIIANQPKPNVNTQEQNYYKPITAEGAIPDTFYSNEVEKAVLGSLILHAGAWDEHKNLTEEDFYFPIHRSAFKILKVNCNKVETTDLLLLSEKIKTQGLLTDIGGEAYLFELAENTPSHNNNMGVYVSLLKERAQRRKLLEIGLELQNNSGSQTVENVMLSAKQKLSVLSENRTAKKLQVLSLKEFLAKDIKARELILSPWLPTQGLAMIFAPRGLGKTFVALNVAYSIASGGEFLGWKAAKPYRVLLIDGEMSAITMQERLASIAAISDKEAIDFELITPDYQANGMPDLSTLEGQEEIESSVQKADVVIVDNLSTLCRSYKENEAEGWTTMQEWALRLRTQGKSIIFIHHAAKNGNQRGTSKKEDILDTVIALKHPKDYKASDGARFEIHFDKTRGFSGKDAEPLLAALITDPDGSQRWAVETLEGSTYQQVVSLTNEGLSPVEICNELEIHKSNVSRYLKRARQEGLLNANKSH